MNYLGLKTWETLPLDLNQNKSLSEFKGKIKNWNLQIYSCQF